MTKMERVVAAMTHDMEKLDRVPVYPILSGITRKLVGADYKTWSTNADVCAEALLKANEMYDQDCIVTLIDLSVECTAWGQELQFEEVNAAHPNYNNLVIQDIDEYEKIKYVDYRTCERMMMHIDVVKKIAAKVGGEVPIVAFVFGPMGVLSMLRNQEEMYMDVYDDPDAVLNATNEVAKTLKDYAEALCDAGADAIMWDTLFASGSIMSADMWVKFEAPAMRMLSEAVRQKGKMNMIHNCGQAIYFDEQIEAIEPSAISFLWPAYGCKDFKETKEKYGDKTTLIGCVTPASAVIGTDEEWDKECTDSIDAMAAGGGFMLATGCEYPSDASFDRAVRMVNIAKTYGKYEK